MAETPRSVTLQQRQGNNASRSPATPDVRLYHRAVVVAQESTGLDDSIPPHVFYSRIFHPPLIVEGTPPLPYPSFSALQYFPQFVFPRQAGKDVFDPLFSDLRYSGP